MINPFANNKSYLTINPSFEFESSGEESKPVQELCLDDFKPLWLDFFFFFFFLTDK